MLLCGIRCLEYVGYEGEVLGDRSHVYTFSGVAGCFPVCRPVRRAGVIHASRVSARVSLCDIRYWLLVRTLGFLAALFSYCSGSPITRGVCLCSWVLLSSPSCVRSCSTGCGALCGCGYLLLSLVVRFFTGGVALLCDIRCFE